eukprot:TRINITY_DN10910_c0_g1_i1.p1 TRINITY_DN10910_c0_g1~~TRINITY_DN10910_c0_g1_i1.p1  ORF type:complete len:110 (+),score=21.24 TRINITY_DN10910_c0_g1_i1:30-359(+)
MFSFHFSSILSFFCSFFFFFFQAEAGIRFLVRSRGLGDVYKRQRKSGVGVVETASVRRRIRWARRRGELAALLGEQSAKRALDGRRRPISGMSTQDNNLRGVSPPERAG